MHTVFPTRVTKKCAYTTKGSLMGLSCIALSCLQPSSPSLPHNERGPSTDFCLPLSSTMRMLQWADHTTGLPGKPQNTPNIPRMCVIFLIQFQQCSLVMLYNSMYEMSSV